MNTLTANLVDQFDFFASGPGLLTIGAVATLILLLWEWRSALVSMLIMQLGVATLAMRVHHLSVEWASVQLLVMLICTWMLALAGRQLHLRKALRPPGPWLLRVMVLLLLIMSWRVFDLNLTIPLIVPAVARLFVWLGLCALVILSLSDNPLFTSIALLLWCMPMQVVVELLAPGHSLFLLIGITEIVLTLACSYLALVAAAPVVRPRTVLTDVAFPDAATARPALPVQERLRLPPGQTQMAEQRCHQRMVGKTKP